MWNELNKASKKLKTEQLSCVVLKNNQFITSKEFGIKPLMVYLREDKTFFNKAVVADKIVGKAAALLLVLGGVEAVYGEVMSEGAKEVLNQNNIPFIAKNSVLFISNRDKTGMCPMEETVKKINSPTKAFEALEKTIAVLMKQKAKA